MNNIPVLNCYAPCSETIKKQTTCSRNSRITALVLGSLLAIAGICLASGAFGNYFLIGGICIAVGCIVVTTALFLRCLKKKGEPDLDSNQVKDVTRDQPEIVPPNLQVNIDPLDKKEALQSLDVDLIMKDLTIPLQDYVKKEVLRLSRQSFERYTTGSFHTEKRKLIFALFMGGEASPYFFNSEEERTAYHKQRLGDVKPLPAI